MSKAAAAKRYERLMKAPGITSSGNGAGVSASPTPTDKNKTPGKGKGKTTSTQTPKKRKLDAVVDDDDDETARSATKSEALKMEKGNSIENKYSNGSYMPTYFSPAWPRTWYRQ